jgi:hypothetical protein
MPDSELGTQAGPVAFVERDKGYRRFVAGNPAVNLEYLLSHRGSAEKFAFHRQKTKLVDRVQDTEFALEFEAIDDHRAWTGADMLRPQVAMGLYDTALFDPFVQKLGPMFEEAELRFGNLRDLSKTRPKAWL